MSPVTPEQALCLAERLLGRRPERLEPFRPKVGGEDSHAFRLWLGGEALLLKIKRRPGSPIGVCFHQRLKQVGVPVPELIAFDAHAGPAREACALWEWIEGEPAEWGRGQRCPYDEAELGVLLRRIHELRFDGAFGLLGDDLAERMFTSHPDLGPVSERWSGFFHCERAARRYYDSGYFTRREADAISSFAERLSDELDQAQPRLLHMGDIMHQGNLIVSPRSRRILAVVDYVESMAGDPRWELAWFDYYFTQCPFARVPFDMARFRAAYDTEHDPADRLGRFYLAAVLLFEKLLFFDPSSRRGRWAIAAVKRLVEN
jgi:aminoglycoside phosphotransferase (APT) family kinase protein